MSSVVNLRLDAELVEAARAKAEREERTVSAVIRRALRRDLEREAEHDGEPKAAA